MPSGVYDHFKLRGRTSPNWILREVRICSYFSCSNSKVNFNREYWTKFFELRLELRTAVLV